MIIHTREEAPRIRPAVFAGSSYPRNADSLASRLDAALQAVNTHTVRQGATAIIAPHIDFRVGLQTYAPAYYALQDSQADVFVVIATSHYGWQDLFIPTAQHFSTPLGVVRTDTDLLAELYAKIPFKLTRDDSAHREEHSIEFEAVWLQHIFSKRTFTILPILVTSFHQFVQKRIAPAETERFRMFSDTLRSVLEASGKNVAWVASADMAHVGRRFDHDFDAEEVLPHIADEDAALIRAMEAANAGQYFRLIANVDDRRNICGLPPVYSMLETANVHGGILLEYDQWNDRPTGSAVTYSSLAYY